MCSVTMTHPRLDRLLPGNVSASDAYLRITLIQREYCEGRSEYNEEREFLDAELSTPEMLGRIRNALTDHKDDDFRVSAATRLISTLQPDAETILLQFLERENYFDRMSLAPTAVFFNTDAVTNKVIQLATSDPVSSVRSEACRGLLGKDPEIVIPVLLQVMHENGTDVDPDDAMAPPRVRAALVLDKVLGTSFMQLRFGAGYATFPPGGFQPEALEAKAKNALKELQSRK